MNADNRETIASVILLHKQKEFRSIFELSSISLNDSNLKKSYHELVRRVHPDKNGTNPDSTLAQHNLADAYAFLQREIEIEIERQTEKENERERKGIKLELNKERKRGKERTILIKREKKRNERDMRSAIVTHLNHILMSAVLALFYLRVTRKDSIRKMQR